MKKKIIFAALAAVFGLVLGSTNSLNAAQVKNSNITWDKTHSYATKVYGKPVGGFGGGLAKVGGVCDTFGNRYYQDYDEHLFTTEKEALTSINKHNSAKKAATKKVASKKIATKKVASKKAKAIDEKYIVRDKHRKDIVLKVYGQRVYPFGRITSTVAGWTTKNGDKKYYTDQHYIFSKVKYSNRLWATLKDSQIAKFTKGASWINEKLVANK